MLETPHVAVGAALATRIPNPYIAIPLALASHFMLEFVPHWNPHLNTETKKYGKPTKQTSIIVAIDVVLSLAIGGFLAYRVFPDTNHSLTILFASFASVLPDVVEGPYFFLGMRNSLIKRWIIFQKSIQNDVPMFPGILTQLVTIVAALWWSV